MDERFFCELMDEKANDSSINIVQTKRQYKCFPEPLKKA